MTPEIKAAQDAVTLARKALCDAESALHAECLRYARAELKIADGGASEFEVDGKRYRIEKAKPYWRDIELICRPFLKSGDVGVQRRYLRLSDVVKSVASNA